MINALLLALQAGTAAPCTAPEYRQFDFWLGNWQVVRTNGQLAGENHITLDLANCTLIEHYTTPSGYEGKSVNGYDAAHKVWRQTWVDNQGAWLRLSGGLEGQQMVLTGQGIGANGQAYTNKITWTPKDNGHIRQHWQVQGTDGQWQTVFDGLYKKIQK